MSGAPCCPALTYLPPVAQPLTYLCRVEPPVAQPLTYLRPVDYESGVTYLSVRSGVRGVAGSSVGQPP